MEVPLRELIPGNFEAHVVPDLRPVALRARRAEPAQRQGADPTNRSIGASPTTSTLGWRSTRHGTPDKQRQVPARHPERSGENRERRCAGDIEGPLSSIREIEVLNDGIPEIHGLTPSGFKSWAPTFRAGSRWAPSSPARTRGRPSQRYTTDNADFGALIIGCDHPEIISG